MRLPPKTEDLVAFVSTVVNMTIRKTGIRFEGLYYWSEELDLLRTRPGGRNIEYVVKIDPVDITKVMVLDHDQGRWLVVPCVSRYFSIASGVSLRQWKQICELAQRETPKGRHVSLSTLWKARREIMDETPRSFRPKLDSAPLKPERQFVVCASCRGN